MSKEESGTRQSRVESSGDAPDASHSYVSNATFGNLSKDVAEDGSRRNMSKERRGACTGRSRLLLMVLVFICLYSLVIVMTENVGFTLGNTQGVQVTKTHTTHSSDGVLETPEVGEEVHAVAKTNERTAETPGCVGRGGCTGNIGRNHRRRLSHQVTELGNGKCRYN
jgi:hypothetical protein